MSRPRRPEYYKLIGRLPVPCRDAVEWAIWFESAAGGGRIVKVDRVGPLRVSTVFLGLDHNFNLDPNQPPLLFETMIFDGIDDAYETRCSTWDQAERMHEVALTEARERLERGKAILSSLREQD